MEPDAIMVLAGGIKQDATGRWVNTDLTAEDNKLGAPGAKLRVLAAALLAARYPEAVIVTGGGKGYDVPAGTTEQRPILAEILRDELTECGVPIDRIVLEQNSNSTYQEFQELTTLIAKRGWRNIRTLTNRYHLNRVRAMIEAEFPELSNRLQLFSAEDILLEADPARWQAEFAEAYRSAFMAERIAKEEQGTKQIKDGTYQFLKYKI
jgi:uncharacterized SAM-binding protein YcdF (DUF218 family)